MTITNTPAGPSLNLWSDAAALEWDRFKLVATEYLGRLGYKPVYTSHAFKKEGQEPFKEWFGDPEKRLLVPSFFHDPNDSPEEIAAERKKFEDCDRFVYCGHKGVNHIQIARELLTSYNDLPILLCEFDQHYSASGTGSPTNRMAVYLTGVAEHGRHSDVAKQLYAALAVLSSLHPNFRLYESDSCEDRCPPGQIQFRNAANEPTDAWLITAVATFSWVEPEKPKPQEPPVPVDHAKPQTTEKTPPKKEGIIDQLAGCVAAFFRLFTG